MEFGFVRFGLINKASLNLILQGRVVSDIEKNYVSEWTDGWVGGWVGRWVGGWVVFKAIYDCLQQSKITNNKISS